MRKVIDVDRLSDAAKDIDEYIKMYDTEINDFFNRIEKMPIDTGEWVGESAKLFAAKAKKDKMQYENFSKELKEISNIIKRDVSNYRTMINNINSKGV